MKSLIVWTITLILMHSTVFTHCWIKGELMTFGAMIIGEILFAGSIFFLGSLGKAYLNTKEENESE